MSQPEFAQTLRAHHLGPLLRSRPRILQVNVGLRCDLACHHCHVEAGPRRTETLDARTAARVLEVLEGSRGITTLDLTGGAPELCTEFRRLVEGARALGRQVIDRCNLTVLSELGQDDTAEFLARNGVHVIASLPCYTAENVDAQRGRRVFERSIEALRRLNGLGYARPGSSLELDLAYNPLGPSLPPAQHELEERYRKELDEQYGIAFDRLLTITNMPIRRFAHALARDGRESEYMSLLVNHFNPATVAGLMCRETISVSWDGRLHDCDFNQMLGIRLGGDGAGGRTLWDLADADALEGREIATAPHCYGCTAGAGSSCGGAIA